MSDNWFERHLYGSVSIKRLGHFTFFGFNAMHGLARQGTAGLDDDLYAVAQAGSISSIVCDYETAMALGDGSGIEG